MLAGLLVILGHNWPVFFQFKGGKGVASSCGVMLVCFPLPAIICFVFCLAADLSVEVYFPGEHVHADAVCHSGVFPECGNWLVIVWSMLLAALCILRHRSNIQRLCRGEENRLGSKKKA